MNWRAIRTVIIHLYAVGFLLLGIFVFYSALSGGQASRLWLSISASILLVAEGIGLYFFVWIARFILKVTLVVLTWVLLFTVIKNGAWLMIPGPLALAGMLFAEIWFQKLDRQIAAARRAARRS
jgi:hypothetical protein